MVGYRKELFAGIPNSLIPRPEQPLDFILDPTDSVVLSFLGRLETSTLGDLAQSLLDEGSDKVSGVTKPDGSQHSSYSSKNSTCTVDSDKEGNLTQLTLKLNPGKVDEAVNGAIEELTRGKAHNLKELEEALKKGEGLSFASDSQTAKRILNDIKSLSKEWKFSYDKEGNVSKMTLDGKTVDPNSFLWQMGDTLRKAQTNSLTMDGHLSGYELDNNYQGVSPSGQPTDVAGKKTDQHHAARRTNNPAPTG